MEKPSAEKSPSRVAAARRTIAESPKAIENKNRLQSCLPDGYIFSSGKLVFPEGYWESYLADGKEYNADTLGDISFEKLFYEKKYCCINP